MNILILEDTNTFVEEFVDILKNNNLFTDAGSMSIVEGLKR